MVAVCSEKHSGAGEAVSDKGQREQRAGKYRGGWWHAHTGGGRGGKAVIWVQAGAGLTEARLTTTAAVTTVTAAPATKRVRSSQRAGDGNRRRADGSRGGGAGGCGAGAVPADTESGVNAVPGT